MYSTPLRRISRRYRRYRYENQYDSPLLILIFDTGIALLKLLLVVLLAWSTWKLISTF